MYQITVMGGASVRRHADQIQHRVETDWVDTGTQRSCEEWFEPKDMSQEPDPSLNTSGAPATFQVPQSLPQAQVVVAIHCGLGKLQFVPVLYRFEVVSSTNFVRND